MDLHVHPCFNFDDILECTGWGGDGFSTDYLTPSLDIDLLICLVPIHIAAEIHPHSVELLEGGRDSQRKSKNLVGRNLFLQRCSRIRYIIDDADHVASIKTIRCSVISR